MPFFMHLHGLQIFSNNCLCISFRLSIFSTTMYRPPDSLFHSTNSRRVL